MQFSMLFFDIDGTLISPDHFTLSPRNRRALERAREAGIRLCIATGRCLGICPEELLTFGFDYAITSNGAAIRDLKTGERLHFTHLPAEDARAAYRVMKDRADFLEWFVDDGILLTRAHHDRIGKRELPPWHQRYFDRGNTPVVERIEDFLDAGAPGLEKINLVCCDPALIADFRAELARLHRFDLSSSLGRGLELSAPGCTKGAAIRRLCALTNTDLADTAAFGDAENDLEMLHTVGCGVAMGNAPDTVKAAADRVTARYDEDGVAVFIEEMLKEGARAER